MEKQWLTDLPEEERARLIEEILELTEAGEETDDLAPLLVTLQATRPSKA